MNNQESMDTCDVRSRDGLNVEQMAFCKSVSGLNLYQGEEIVKSASYKTQAPPKKLQIRQTPLIQGVGLSELVAEFSCHCASKLGWCLLQDRPQPATCRGDEGHFRESNRVSRIPCPRLSCF